MEREGVVDPSYPFVLVWVHPETLRRGGVTIGALGERIDQVSVLDSHWQVMKMKAEERELSSGLAQHEYAVVMMAVPVERAGFVVDAMRSVLAYEAEVADGTREA